MKFVSNAKYNEPVESGTIYRGKTGNLDVCVHRVHCCEGWYLSCSYIGISRMELKSETLLSAIKESKGILKQFADRINSDVSSFYESVIEISRY